MLIDIVRQLGEEVEAAWARADYAIDAFAPIAAGDLERYALHEQFDLGEFSDWLSQTGELAEQLGPRSKFGDPPITLWRSSRFVILADERHEQTEADLQCLCSALKQIDFFQPLFAGS